MVIKYVIGVSAIAENFIVRIYEAESPLAEVANMTVPAPHSSPFLVTFNGLDRVVHIVKLFGVSSGFLYETYNDEPKEDLVTIFTPIHFKVGDGQPGTPVNGTSSYVNPALIGLTINDFLLNKAGYGYYIPNVHYSFNPTTGSIGLASPDIFSSDGGGDEYWIFRNPTSNTTPVNDSVVGKLFGGFLDVTGSISYLPAHLRKLIRMSAGSTYTFTGAIPVGYNHAFNQMGASGTATINFSNAPLKRNGATVTSLTLSQGSTGAFTFDGTNWNIINYSDNSNTLSAYARIIYTARFTLGDIVSDSYFTIAIPHQPDINYFALGSFKAAVGADPNLNNDCSFCFYDYTVDNVKLAVRELDPEYQNLFMEIILVRNN